MDKSIILSGVLATLREVAPEVEPLSLVPDRTLRTQVDLDSMDWLNVILGWHRRFGVEIPEADYAGLDTLDAITAYLQQRMPA
jgi:acyl carrier protein